MLPNLDDWNMVKVLKASDVHVYVFFLASALSVKIPESYGRFVLRGDLLLSDKVLTCLALFVWIFFMMLLGGTGMKGSTWIGPDKNGKSGGNPKLMAIKIEKMMFFRTWSFTNSSWKILLSVLCRAPEKK